MKEVYIYYRNGLYLLVMVTTLSLLALVACQKEEAVVEISFLDSIKNDTGPIDSWIMENYTDPYNIIINYKWDPYELPLNKVLVPVKEDKVIPVMTVIKKTWIEPYSNRAGDMFMKKNAPKQFVLVGSAQYNSDGTYVLGEAESGRKVTLYVINDFDNKNVPAVKQMLHTIHHEFGHILHQTILYPREYKQITSSGYTASWYNTSVDDAHDLGFITPYSRSGTDDDFVEMIATMLVEGKDGYEKILSTVSPQGLALLRKKEAIVVAYFQSAWNIDFYKLQSDTEAAIIHATQ